MSRGPLDRGAEHRSARSAPIPAWTDELWDELWERSLGHVERHRLAMALLRREVPADPYGRRIVPELARRWRRSCVVYAFGWGLFTLFWLSIAIAIAEIELTGSSTLRAPRAMVGLGSSVIGVALGLRWWIRDVAGPRPGAG